MNETALSKEKNDLRSVLGGDKFKEQIALALPSHMKPERFARIALTALTKTPKLLDCTKESVLKCCMDLSSFGLEPDGRRAYLIPYGKECTLIVSYIGLIELAKRSGDVAKWVPQTVCEKDDFTWDNGEVDHKINFREDRGRVQCVYSKVTFKDGTTDVEVMTLDECNAVRDRSRAKDGPWKTDYIAMCLKTAIRRHSKRMTLSSEFVEAMERDDDPIDAGRGMRNVTPTNTGIMDPFAAPPPPEALEEVAGKPIIDADDPSTYQD